MAKDAAALLDSWEKKNKQPAEKSPAALLDAWEKKKPEPSAAAMLDALEKKQQPFSLKPPPGMGYKPEEYKQVIKRDEEFLAAREQKPKAAPKKENRSFVDLTSPAQQVKRNPELAKGGAGRQVMAGAGAAMEAVDQMAGGALTRAGAVFAPIHDLKNKVGEELAKVSAKYGRIENVPDKEMLGAWRRAASRWAPWQSLKQQVLGVKATDDQMFTKMAQGDPAFRQRLNKIGGPAVADFLFSMVTDAPVGKLQGGLVRGLEKVDKGGLAVRGKQIIPPIQAGRKIEKAVPAIGRMAEARRGRVATAEQFGKAEARQQPVLQKTADTLERERQLSQRLMRQGAKIRRKDPLTGRTENVATRVVADVMEAGSEGSRFSVKPQGPSTARLQKQLTAAQKVLPTRAKVAQKAVSRAGEAQTAFQDAKAAQQTAQTALQQERKAAGAARTSAQELRGKAQTAAQQAAVAEAQAAERSRSLAQLRDKQAERMGAARKAEEAVPGLQADAEAAAQAHGAARKKAADLQRSALAAERRAATLAKPVGTGRTPEIRQARRAELNQARAEADALKQQLKVAQADEAQLLRQTQERQRELERGRAAAEQARRLTPTTEGMQLARQRADEAAARAAKARKEADALKQQAQGAWQQSRQAQQPVTAATRAAGRAQQSVFTAEKAATRAGNQATRAQQRAAGAQMRTATLGAQTSLPAVKAGQAARRAAELKLIEKDAARYGISPDDFAEIKDIAQQWQGVADELGQGLVRAGRLSPEAFERMRGVYLPRLYAIRAAHPKDAQKYLNTLLEQGAISKAEAVNVLGEIDQRVRGVGGARADFTKARDAELLRLDPSKARIAEGSSSVAMSRYATNASRETAEAEALREIVQNPELVQPMGQGPLHWKVRKLDGVDYQVNPGVAAYLDMRNNDDLLYAAIRKANPTAANGWRKLNQSMRQTWMSMPASAINNAAGNYQLGASAAAINGARYSLPGYLKAAREWRLFRKTGKADALLEEALTQTDLLSEGAGVIPKSAREVGSGFGVETLGDKLKRAPGEFVKGEMGWQQAYSDFMLRDPEKAGRFYLYKELRQSGKSVDEAAKITRAAMIDYSDVNIFQRTLDQNNILPFLTFPTKAVFQYMNLAVRRPDLFKTFTGERLRNLLDQLADEAAEREGREPTAKKARARGDAGLTAFPIPGMKDSQGKQAYLRSGALAPIAQISPQGATDMSAEAGLDWIKERATSAAPLARVPLEILLNRSAYTQQPIIEPGTTPGGYGDVRDLNPLQFNPEAARKLGLYAGKAFIPQIGAGERLYHGFQGTTPYASSSQAPMSPGAALLQTFTGIAIKEGMADSPEEKRDRTNARRNATIGDEYDRFAADYQEKLYRGAVKPDPSYVAFAAKLKDPAEIDRWVSTLNKKTLNEIIRSRHATGEDKMRSIRGHLEWVMALANRLNELRGLPKIGEPR